MVTSSFQENAYLISFFIASVAELVGLIWKIIGCFFFYFQFYWPYFSTKPSLKVLQVPEMSEPQYP